MAAVTWPTQLPAPSWQNYTLEPLNAVERTDMEQGEARQRRRFQRVPARAALRFRLTANQYAIFDGWFSNVAGGGSVWFDLPLLTAFGLETVEARFLSSGSGERPYQAAPQRGGADGGGIWIVTCAVEIRDRQQYSAEVLAVLLTENVDGLIAAVDALDIYVNVTLPADLGTV